MTLRDEEPLSGEDPGSAGGNASHAPPPSAPSCRDIETDDQPAARVHSSRAVRSLLLACGVLCIALGTAGLVLPVLPTTPFMLLAAYCFARASPALHRRLVESRLFGPTIRQWQRERTIPWQAKLAAIALVSGTIATLIAVWIRT